MKKVIVTLFFVLSSISTAYANEQLSNVSINGVRITTYNLNIMERQLGIKFTAGTYIINPYNGCWAHVESGQGGCSQPQANNRYSNRSQNNGHMYNSRFGSGEQYQNGSWVHRSNIAGMGVGGTSNGCLYVGSWSNC